MTLWRRFIEWVAFTVFWMLLVFNTDTQNMVAAAIAALITVIGINIGSKYLHASFSFPRGWLSVILKLPWKIVQDTGRVFLALFQQIVRREQTVGQLVNVPFDYGSNSSEDSGRLAISIFGISVTPNTVAITTTSDSIFIHQLEPTSEPAERRDPKWPV